MTVLRRALVATSTTLLLTAPIATAVSIAATPTVAQVRRDQAAERFVQVQANRVLQILNDRSMPTAQKSLTFQGLVDQIADIPRITSFVLGKYNRAITPAQKQEFTTLFRDFANNVWETRLGEYGGEQLQVTGSVIRAPGDAVVTSRVQGGKLKQANDVNWRVIRGADGRWRAVDVQIQGVWLAITQQQDFVSTIDNAGGNIDVLINQLRSQIASRT